MKDRVLVDSSVWFAATRLGGDPQIAAELGELLLSGRAAMTEPVWIELFQGIKGKREEARLAESKKVCTWLTFDEACWTEAAATARACLPAGRRERSSRWCIGFRLCDTPRGGIAGTGSSFRNDPQCFDVMINGKGVESLISTNPKRRIRRSRIQPC